MTDIAPPIRTQAGNAMARRQAPKKIAAVRIVTRRG
jgi:hypothetical protein